MIKIHEQTGNESNSLVCLSLFLFASCLFLYFLIYSDKIPSQKQLNGERVTFVSADTTASSLTQFLPYLPVLRLHLLSHCQLQLAIQDSPWRAVSVDSSVSFLLIDTHRLSLLWPWKLRNCSLILCRTPFGW